MAIYVEEKNREKKQGQERQSIGFRISLSQQNNNFSIIKDIMLNEELDLSGLDTLCSNLTVIVQSVQKNLYYLLEGTKHLICYQDDI